MCVLNVKTTVCHLVPGAFAPANKIFDLSIDFVATPKSYTVYIYGHIAVHTIPPLFSSTCGQGSTEKSLPTRAHQEAQKQQPISKQKKPTVSLFASSRNSASGRDEICLTFKPPASPAWSNMRSRGHIFCRLYEERTTLPSNQ